MRGYLTIAVVVLLNSCEGYTVSAYSASADATAHGDAHPVIVLDEGHNNFGNKRNAFFADMEQFLAGEGFELRQHARAITLNVLKGVSILHTDNALAPENQDNWSLPTPSAFNSDEISVIYNWVHDGGSLLIIIEHMPFGGSYEDLASAFNVETSNGFAVDQRLLNDYSEKSIEDAGYFVFSRDSGLLADHPILTGRRPHERIESVAADVGSALRLPESAVSLMTLGSDAVSLEPSVSWEFESTTPRRPVAGWSQAGVMKIGKGRVAVLGDNFPYDYPQLTVNLYRWLSGQL